jgi:NAD(P)H-dependent FMN reductase
VSYGGSGGARAAEQLRLVMGEIKITDVRTQVLLSLHNDFEHYTTFKPGPHQALFVHPMLDEVIAWSGALKPLRTR